MTLRLRLVLALGCASVAVLEAPSAIGVLTQALPGADAPVAQTTPGPALEISVAGLDR